MKTRMKHYLSLTNNLQMSNNRFEFREMFETNDGPVPCGYSVYRNLIISCKRIDEFDS
jgi:hypothetical protein